MSSANVIEERLSLTLCSFSELRHFKMFLRIDLALHFDKSKQTRRSLLSLADSISWGKQDIEDYISGLNVSSSYSRFYRFNFKKNKSRGFKLLFLIWSFLSCRALSELTQVQTSQKLSVPGRLFICKYFKCIWSEAFKSKKMLLLMYVPERSNVDILEQYLLLTMQPRPLSVTLFRPFKLSSVK